MGPSFFRVRGPGASALLSVHGGGVAMTVSVSRVEPRLPVPGPASRDGSTHLTCLLEVVQAVNSTLQLQQVLNLILDRAILVMQAEAGSIMMLDESSGELQVRAARGARAAEIFRCSMKLGEGAAGWAALHGQPLRPVDGML